MVCTRNLGWYQSSSWIESLVFLQLRNISLGCLAIICSSHENTSYFPKIPIEDYVHSISKHTSRSRSSTWHKAKLWLPKYPLVLFPCNNFGRGSFSSQQDLIQNFFITKAPNIRILFVSFTHKNTGFSSTSISSHAGKFLFLVLDGHWSHQELSSAEDVECWPRH